MAKSAPRVSSSNPERSDTAALHRTRVQLYVGAFLVDAMNFGYAVAISAHAQYALGASLVQIGILAAVGRAVYAVASHWAGRRSEVLGSAPLMRQSLLGLGLVALPLTFFVHHSVLQLVIVNALTRWFLGLYWSPLERQLSLASPGRTLWRAIGVMNLMWGGGSALGFLCWPLLYDEFGFGPAVFVALGCTWLAGLIFLASPPTKARAEAKIPQESVSPERALLFARLGQISNFCAYFTGGSLPFFFVYLARVRDITLPQIGGLLAIAQVTQLLAFVWLWKSPRWHYSLAGLVSVQLIGGVAMVLCGLVESATTLCVLLGLFGIFQALSYYSSLFYGLNLRSREGSATGTHEAVLAAGSCLGPVVSMAAGTLFPRHPGAVLVAPGGVILLGLAVELYLVRRLARGRR